MTLSDISTLEPICETITLLLGESQSNDITTSIELVLQTHSFFSEILETTPTKKTIPLISSAINLFFSSINKNILSFISDDNYFKKLESILLLFLQSKYYNEALDGCAQFIATILVSETISQNIQILSPFLEKFFNSTSAVPFFTKCGGLCAIWDLFFKINSATLFRIILASIQRTINAYTDHCDTVSLISHIIESLPDLPLDNALDAFQFLFDIFSTSEPLYKLFKDKDGFSIINDYIAKYNDSQLLFIYQMFRSLVTSEDTTVVKNLVNFILIPSISPELRLASLTQLSSSVRQDICLSPGTACSIAQVITDSESAAALFDIVLYCATRGLDCSMVIGSLSNLAKYEFLMESNCKSLFQILLSLETSCFEPFAPSFFSIIDDQEKFDKISQKYPEFLTLVAQSLYAYPDFWPLFINNAKTNKTCDLLQQALFNIKSLEKLEFYDTFVLQNLLIVLSQSFDIRHFFENKCVDALEGINDPVLIFDIIAATAGRHFNEQFDVKIFDFLRAHNFYDQSNETIWRLSLGLTHDDVVSGRIVLPSLLIKCYQKAKITSPFDQWICSEYVIDKWLKETGKDITEFPSIEEIAKRYVTPKQALLILEKPSLFHSSIPTSPVIPLFEFPKFYERTRFFAKLQKHDQASVTFWFYFKEFPPSKTAILNFDGLSIVADQDSIIADHNKIATFQQNKWYFMCVTADKLKTFIYIDCKQCNSSAIVKRSDSLNGHVQFSSSKVNQATWFIGGAVRVFGCILSANEMRHIFSKGVSHSIKELSSECYTITPKAYAIQMVKKSINTSIGIGECCRPSIVYPISDHGFVKGKSVFYEILTKSRDVHYVQALIALQSLEKTGWDLVQYARHLSCLIHISPDLFNVPLLNSALSLFCNDTYETMDWDAFFEIVFDFGIWNSELSNAVLSNLYGYLARFPLDSERANKLAKFAFDLITKENIENLSIIDLFSRLPLEPSTLSRIIACLPSHKVKLYTELFNLYITNIDPEASFLFYALPPNDSLEIIQSLIKQKMPIDTRIAIRFCLMNCSFPKAWSVALSLAFKIDVDIENGLDFEPTEIVTDLLHVLLIMVSILEMACIANEGSTFWTKLCNKIFNILVKSVSFIPVSTFGEQSFQFAVVQLLSAGTFTPSFAAFPFCPSIIEAAQVAPICLNQGHPFPTDEAPRMPFPTSHEDTDLNWPTFIESSLKSFGIDEIPPIEKIENSSFMSSSLKFAVTCLTRTMNSELFESVFKTFAYLHPMVDAKHSLFIAEKIITALLDECCQKMTSDKSLITLILGMIKQGWISQPSIIPILSMIFVIYQDDSLTHSIPFLFTILDSGDELADLCIANDSSFKKLTNFDEILLFVDSIAKCEQSRAQYLVSIFIDQIEGEADEVEAGIMMLKETSPQTFMEWIDQNDHIKERLIQVKQTDFDTKLASITDSLTFLNNERMKLMNAFFSFANQVLDQSSIDQSKSKSHITSIIESEELATRLEIFMFLRKREALLSEYRFDTKKSTVKGISILNDPLYPTRRIEPSPIVYNVPPFTVANYTNIFSPTKDLPDFLPLLPLSIKQEFAIEFMPITVFARYEQYDQLSFSFITNLPDSALFTALKKMIGQDIVQQCDASILAGFDPLPGALFITSHDLIFAEGIKVTDSGVTFSTIKTNPTLYAFYLSYIAAGSFGPFFLFGGHPVLKWPLSDIISIRKHFWLQSECSLEANTLYGWSFILIPSLLKEVTSLLTNTVSTNLSKLPATTVKSPVYSARLIQSGLKSATKQWQDGYLSNFDYLCLLNKFSSRSMIDVSQYYVFPWTETDFEGGDCIRDLSLPMGQIGEERLDRWDGVWEDSSHSYFYGTHYIHLGVVLFFNFRVDPFCMFSIYFHHGWDHPNRVFFDMKEAWMSAAHLSQSDVKELVPQLYCVPEILENKSLLPLTSTTDGRSIVDVRTAKWAHDSDDFIFGMRKTLECEKVSKTINHWIDLIFGCKSRGEMAIQAKNVFHSLCYQNRQQNIDRLEDEEKEAAITCIINFGQVPVQLFRNHHPDRFVFNRKHLMSDPSLFLHQRLNPQMFVRPIGDIGIRGKTIISASNDGRLVGNSTIALHYAGGCFVKGPHNEQINVLIHNGKSVKLYQTCDLVRANCYEMSNDQVLLAVAFSDGKVEVLRMTYSGEVTEFKKDFEFIASEPVNSLAVSTCHFLIAAGLDRSVELFDSGRRVIVGTIEVGYHPEKMCFDDEACRLVICGEKNISIYKLSGELVVSKTVESDVSALLVSPLEEFVENRFLITGHNNGYVKFWRTNDLECMKMIKVSDARIVSVAIDENVSRAVAATRNEVFCFDFIGSDAVNMKKKYAVDCSMCGAMIGEGKATAKICVNCHRFFCNKCLPQEQIIKIGNLQKKKHLCPHCSSLIEVEQKMQI